MFAVICLRREEEQYLTFRPHLPQASFCAPHSCISILLTVIVTSGWMLSLLSHKRRDQVSERLSDLPQVAQIASSKARSLNPGISMSNTVPFLTQSLSEHKARNKRNPLQNWLVSFVAVLTSLLKGSLNKAGK